ncbi:hypothetical protein BRADI_2g35392v3 [Brachypodium distachyon]|uniref:Uncharacterized protein n=1 Tax=Brachypodium distachyon TaxID=15368 RepID=A0A2K2DBX1_BRADI|nr:hypothetical protein BRADI_2g35392v3 [Brachypodium distachyon]
MGQVERGKGGEGPIRHRRGWRWRWRGRQRARASSWSPRFSCCWRPRRRRTSGWTSWTATGRTISPGGPAAAGTAGSGLVHASPAGHRGRGSKANMLFVHDACNRIHDRRHVRPRYIGKPKLHFFCFLSWRIEGSIRLCLVNYLLYDVYV